MPDKPFDKDTTLAEILKENPALIEIFEHWGVHLMASTVTALISPLSKTASRNGITNLEGLLVELNAKRTIAATQDGFTRSSGQTGKK